MARTARPMLFCPLKFGARGPAVPPGEHAAVAFAPALYTCDGDRCAWWDEEEEEDGTVTGDCAVKALPAIVAQLPELYIGHQIALAEAAASAQPTPTPGGDPT